jgi:uridylate kinase
VDGVYSADPKKDAKAQRFEKVTFQEVLEKGLKVMDASAIALCMDNELPILVFNMMKPGNLVSAVLGESVGTLIH